MVVTAKASRFHVWANRWDWYTVRGMLDRKGRVLGFAIYDDLNGSRCPALEAEYADVAARLLRESARASGWLN